jgi:hypothetical protein
MVHFVRELVDENMKIKSTCVTGGSVIIASVTEGLIQMEQQHVIACDKGGEKQPPGKVTISTVAAVTERRTRPRRQNH